MKLADITLKNFRNLEDIKITFSKNITVLIGDNAQGKTNYLESIYFLATGKPVRVESDEEIIKLDELSVRAQGSVSTKDEDNAFKLATVLVKADGRLTKKFLVNGIPRRLIDYSGKLVVVFFRPEDLNLVAGSPGVRREYIDETISQADREYRKILNYYLKIITQKNKLLKLIREGIAKPDELEFWNSQQLKHGISLQEKRHNFFNAINSYEKKFGDFYYEYIPNIISEERLKEIKIREVGAAMSLIGPHRDDFQFILDGKDLAKYGSRGEQRTAVLDLKITELIFFENILGERPVLLLDDIFSELDLAHRQHVLDLAKLQQTIIATVEFDDYLKKALKNEQILKVKNGVIN